MAKKRKRKKKAVEAVQAQAAAMARATFSRKTDFKDRKKEAARRACRGKLQEE